MKQLLRIAPIALMIGLVVPAMHPSVVSASPVDQAQQRVEDIVDELERLEERALQISSDYVEALDTQATLADEIVQLEADIAAKEAELSTLRADLGDMAVRSFVGSGGAPLGPLFEDTADINDVLHRDELARVALSAGDITTDELDAFVSDLEDDRADLDDKREQAERLPASLVAYQEETERLTVEYQQARVTAEAELGQAIADEEARRAAEAAARFQAEYEAAQAAAQAANQANSSTSNSGGSTSNSGGASSSDSGGGSSSGSGGGTPAVTNSGGGSSTPANSGGGSSSGGSSSGGGGASAPPVSAPPVSSLASVAVSAALGQQGVPYRYATSSPGVAFDCSGLTKYAWGKAGVYLPHQSGQQYASIPHVSQGAAQPGDLLFYYSPISHVGIYLGGGQLVHAPATGDVVKVASVNWGKVSGVGRPG